MQRQGTPLANEVGKPVSMRRRVPRGGWRRDLKTGSGGSSCNDEDRWRGWDGMGPRETVHALASIDA